jgi:hypothetical protein
LKKGRGMDWEGRKKQMIVKEERKKVETKSDRKEEISSTEFPEGGDTIYTDDLPASHGRIGRLNGK